VSARSKARKRALDVLFEAEARREAPLAVLEARTIQADPPITPFAIELVQGVQAHRRRIDELLAENSYGWTLDRMPAVDRNILRIGAYELLWGIGVPAAVVINEAVLLARDLSTDASPAFVNGLLAKLLELKPELLAAEARDEQSAEPGSATPGSAAPGSAEPGGAESGSAAPGGAEPGGAEPGIVGGSS
jgi:N utilization substance protein B